MDILDNLGKEETPEPNMDGVNFDCQTCRVVVTKAFYDRKKNNIYYWCSDGHESVLEEVNLDL